MEVTGEVGHPSAADQDKVLRGSRASASRSMKSGVSAKAGNVEKAIGCSRQRRRRLDVDRDLR
jgi:hypothetical protein